MKLMTMIKVKMDGYIYDAGGSVGNDDDDNDMRWFVIIFLGRQ